MPAGRAFTNNGVVSSRESVMLLPGRKWLPCSASVAPLATLLLPLNDKSGANTVKPSVVILPMRTSGIRMAMISNGAHPPFGVGLTGG